MNSDTLGRRKQRIEEGSLHSFFICKHKRTGFSRFSEKDVLGIKLDVEQAWNLKALQEVDYSFDIAVNITLDPGTEKEVMTSYLVRDDEDRELTHNDPYGIDVVSSTNDTIFLHRYDKDYYGNLSVTVAVSNFNKRLSPEERKRIENERKANKEKFEEELSALEELL